MMVLIYEPIVEDTDSDLIRVMKLVIPARELEIFPTIPLFMDRIMQPKKCPTIVVLHAVGLQDLEELLVMREWIRDMRIILILPDHEKSTIAKGHQFHPSFLTYGDNDFREIAAVIQKLQNNPSQTQDWYYQYEPLQPFQCTLLQQRKRR